MPVSHQDHCRVTMAVPISSGGVDQLFNLGPVRCSRLRRSLFGRRNGPTARFLVAGVTSCRSFWPWFWASAQSQTASYRRVRAVLLSNRPLRFTPPLPVLVSQREATKIISGGLRLVHAVKKARLSPSKDQSRFRYNRRAADRRRSRTPRIGRPRIARRPVPLPRRRVRQSGAASHGQGGTSARSSGQVVESGSVEVCGPLKARSAAG